MPLLEAVASVSLGPEKKDRNKHGYWLYPNHTHHPHQADLKIYGRFSRLAQTADNALNNIASDNHMCNQPWNTNISIRQHRRTSPHQIRRPRARLVKCLSQTIKANQLTPRMILQTLLTPTRVGPVADPHQRVSTHQNSPTKYSPIKHLR